MLDCSIGSRLIRQANRLQDGVLTGIVQPAELLEDAEFELREIGSSTAERALEQYLPWDGPFTHAAIVEEMKARHGLGSRAVNDALEQM